MADLDVDAPQRRTIAHARHPHVCAASCTSAVLDPVRVLCEHVRAWLGLGLGLGSGLGSGSGSGLGLGSHLRGKKLREIRSACRRRVSSWRQG